ncbi:MAG: indolepyruvate ferredoxin oxidoreductase subunit alpha [Oscillospiraceae bacterium]|jgi:indolepyruvate ferredoxin oxidoreductase alpha subunit|nr:indolepyruvate ferredoxin oxidoreductase subunit alpha [Oscillospiraceae bacterium]
MSGKRKVLMMGNEAVARGLTEAGCSFVSSYPGTPSTEITEFAAKTVYAEWAPNEKVAVEAALGASLAGARSFSGMKHVGVNVAADPLFTAAYTGINGGVVIAVADDPGCHSSQNEQDSRHYAEAMKLPMLEPSDSQECLDFTKTAFTLSERFDTPVLLRLTTRISHSRSAVTVGEIERPVLREYQKNPGKNVMVPAAARVRHAALEERLASLGDFCEESGLNRIEWGTERKIGVVASGISYQTAREALGDSASYLKLGMVFPLPVLPLRELAEAVDELWVIEELDDFIETHCKKHGLKVWGKADLTPLGEYTVPILRQAVLGETAEESPQSELLLNNVPPRPPVLCPGCPHWGTFGVIKKLNLTVMGDIGCYTLGASPPLSSMDFCVCMGASVSSLHGFLKVRPDRADKAVAVIGDSTFMHSGLTGLMNIVYNQTPATVLILDNAITGMTGHQQNPGTGLTLMGQSAPVLDLEAVCRSLGVKRVVTADPRDPAALEAALKEELAASEPSVVVVRRPCALLEGSI